MRWLRKSIQSDFLDTLGVSSHEAGPHRPYLEYDRIKPRDLCPSIQTELRHEHLMNDLTQVL